MNATGSVYYDLLSSFKIGIVFFDTPYLPNFDSFEEAPTKILLDLHIPKNIIDSIQDTNLFEDIRRIHIPQDFNAIFFDSE